MTDEELEAIKLPPCYNDTSHITSVRSAGNGWFYVGCVDCFNKRMCDEARLQDTIDSWVRYSERVLKRKGLM